MGTRLQKGDEFVVGGVVGRLIAGTVTVAGAYELPTPAGAVSGNVWKARGPDEPLNGVQVWLVESTVASGRYCVLVDDAYWGLRAQPAEFQSAPFREDFVMGYRLSGQVLRNGEPVAGAPVSLEVRVATAEDGEVVFWDSEEYNELVYSEDLETWVEGPVVTAPIVTDGNGRWSYVVPKGHGAAYQRAGDLLEDSNEAPASARVVTRIDALYLGHRAEVAEGRDSEIRVDDGSLEIVGAPGAFVRVGPMDDVGQVYEVPESGVVALGNLPIGEHTVVQFRRTPWGTWDSTWGCPRAVVSVIGGTTVRLTLPPMEPYPPEGGLVAGRVYERPGVPCAGIAVQIINTETGEIVGTAAVTDENGFWSATIPENGFGGDLWIHDARWGSVPVVGYPYSDIVLGARLYSAWLDEFRPEAWRKGTFGHRNYPYVEGVLWVESEESGERVEVTEAPYGGWVTLQTLPKYKYVPDIPSLVSNGPQERHYAIVAGDGPLETGITLGSQSFEDWETPAGMFRATGHYPEAKWLLGGKVHGNVVLDSAERVTIEEPEAARVGLEFGALADPVEVRTAVGEGACTHGAFTGFLCPYCGAPSWRDPDTPARAQGYCVQCAELFGDARAMDCRSYFRAPTTGTEGLRQLRCIVPRKGVTISRRVRFHWRPELYDENDSYLRNDGAGQRTNAPRWVAKHLDEVGDGLGLGYFDSDQTPPFTAGHHLSYFGNLPEVGRELGCAQAKFVFASGYVMPVDVTVAVDVELVNGEIETFWVTIPQGTRGPDEGNPLGDAVRVCPRPKLKAEMVGEPYRRTGLGVAVRDVRLVEPPSVAGCRFHVVADVPFLASPTGIALKPRMGVPVAVQVDRWWGDPCIVEDAYGQLLVAYVDEGDVVTVRRPGMDGNWDQPTKLTEDGANACPSVAKDGCGVTVVTYQHGQHRTMIRTWRDDCRGTEV
jgi:hypothetical protein